MAQALCLEGPTHPGPRPSQVSRGICMQRRRPLSRGLSLREAGSPWTNPVGWRAAVRSDLEQARCTCTRTHPHVPTVDFAQNCAGVSSSSERAVGLPYTYVAFKGTNSEAGLGRPGEQGAKLFNKAMYLLWPACITPTSALRQRAGWLRGAVAQPPCIEHPTSSSR